VDLYTPLSIFGYNIVASEGEDWKKYRRISAPAFSEVRSTQVVETLLSRNVKRNNKLVWDETVAIMNDLFDNVWGNKEVVTVDQCLDLTLTVCQCLKGLFRFDTFF
jgi:cytochrome P450